MKWSLIDKPFDPTAPSMLLFDLRRDPPVLVGFSYWVHSTDAPAGFAGDPDVKVYNWPLPYDKATNPLSIDLTAVNTFILICSSVTISIRPPDSSRAASARCQEAGLPILMAVAIVCGCATGAPSTIGAAPEAWKPNIRGFLDASPSEKYSS